MRSSNILKTNVTWHWLVLIVILSVLLKLGLFFIQDTNTLTRAFRPDTWTYLIPAYRWILTGNLSPALHHYLFFRTPGYPLLIGGILLFGNHLQAVLFVQIALSSVMVVSAYAIFKRLFSNRVGLLAALIVAVDYLIIGYSLLVMTDILFATLLSIVVWIAVVYFTHYTQRYGLLISMGILIALATWVRPIGYYYLLPLSIGIGVYGWTQGFEYRTMLLGLLVLWLPFLCLVGGWEIRNHVLLHQWRFSDLTSPASIVVFFPKNYQQYLKDEGLVHQESTALSHLTLEKDIDMLLHHPELTMQQVGSGLLKIGFGTDRALLQLLGNAKDLQQFNQLKQHLLAHNIKKLFASLWQSDASFVAGVYLLGGLLFNVLVLLFMAIALVSLLVRKNKRADGFAHTFLLGTVFYFLLFSANAASYARFRLPFQLILDGYAAAGICYLFYNFRRMRHRYDYCYPVRENIN